MISSNMVGAAEVMTDDGFASWIEKQMDALLDRLSVFELYKLYRESKKLESVCENFVDKSTMK